MRRLHIDCFAGASGDMMLAALLDLGPASAEAAVREALASLGLPGELSVAKVRKNGFAATRITVAAADEKKHRHLSHIERIVAAAALTDGARELALRMFRRLGEAEALSHGIPVEKVHFHEVGAVDSIFDFVGVAVAVDALGPLRVTCEPVPTGRGFVTCDHGTLPVPPPAVANLLVGVPLAAADLEGEMTTPTGAAILTTLAEGFGPRPAMRIDRIGLGAGTRDWPDRPNLLRLLLGAEEAEPAPGLRTDAVWQLETNLDDASGEVIGHALARLMEAGALDVAAIPATMKKGRPGVVLRVLCHEDRLEATERLLLAETGTFGVRRALLARTVRERVMTEVVTPWGRVAGKLGFDGSAWLFTPEYEDCAALARVAGVTLRAVQQAALVAYETVGRAESLAPSAAGTEG